MRKPYVNEADWGCGCFILISDFVSCDIIFSLLTQLNRRRIMSGETKEVLGSNYDQNDVIINGLIDKMTLFDDNLMSLVFGQNIETKELLLRVIM